MAMCHHYRLLVAPVKTHSSALAIGEVHGEEATGCQEYVRSNSSAGIKSKTKRNMTLQEGITWCSLLLQETLFKTRAKIVSRLSFKNI